MQAWYNSTKDAILNAEKERKRKGIDVEKLSQELEEEEAAADARVNVKRFSIESFNSWKADLMNCDNDNPGSIKRMTSKEKLLLSDENNLDKNCSRILSSLGEEKKETEETEERKKIMSTSSLPRAQLVSIEDHLSSEDCKALTRMEKATAIIDEDNYI